MIISNGENQGDTLPDLGYANGRGLAGNMILRLTRHLRSVNAEKYILGGHRLLDVGCGDGYFLKRANCKERYGIDKLLGDEVESTLDFPDEYFDYVTMLAVIEHFTNPYVILKEVHRVLKPNGKFVFTTPKEKGEFLIRLYLRDDIDDHHESYFDHERVVEFTDNLFEISGHHTFALGFNQAYCLKKVDRMPAV